MENGKWKIENGKQKMENRKWKKWKKKKNVKKMIYYFVSCIVIIT